MAGNLRMFKRTYISPPAASDSGIERHRDAIFRPRELALCNNRYDLCEYYFEGLAFSVASVISELYGHIRFTLFCIIYRSYLKERNEVLYLLET